jgi:membrane protein YdbS with pleckstrin-like domain
MDFFNNDFKEYVGRDEKTLAHSAIKPAVYWFTSFFVALFFIAFISFPVSIIAIGKAREVRDATTITIKTKDGKSNIIKIPETPKSESVAEAARRTVEKAERTRNAIESAGSILAGAFLLIWILGALRSKSFKYVVTSRGLYQIGGIVFKHSKFVAYGKITDTTLKRGLVDLVLGTGTIGISTAGGTRSAQGNSQPYEVRFRNVPDYKKLQELVHKGLK